MSVNGIQGYSQVDAYQAYNSVKKSTNEKKTDETSSSSAAKAAETGVIYEKSSEAEKVPGRHFRCLSWALQVSPYALPLGIS